MICACGNPTSDPRCATCRPCSLKRLNSNPEIRARRIAGLKRYVAQNREAHLERAKRAGRTKRNNPQLVAHLRERIKEVQPLSVTPEALAKRDNVQRGWSLSAARLPWCPRGYLPLYRYWINSRHKKAAEAKELVLKQIAEDRAASHPCFEAVVRFMQRFTSVTSTEGGYNVGMVKLTPGELLTRAERHGYQSESLAA